MRNLFNLVPILLLSIAASSSLRAQTMQLTTSNEDFEITNIFSEVNTFDFSIEINEPLAAGVFINPPIISVSYRVSGNLTAGTPSGFEAFALEREITGEEFYAQGSSLQFEISDSAVLEDGVQVVELVGTDVVFRFDGREINNGRFHPALFELRADGTGRIQNSNNTPTLEPLLDIEFGAEYINDLVFDSGNTTLITGELIGDTMLELQSEADVNSNGGDNSSDSDGFLGIGVFSYTEWLVFLFLVMGVRYQRRNSAREEILLNP